MEAAEGNGAKSNNSNGSNEPVQTSKTKLTFTATKSRFSASRPPLFPKVRRGDDGDRKDVELVAGFDEQGVVAKSPKGLRGARVIPKLENSWRPEKRMKNIVMETDIMTFTSTEERFEKHEHIREGPTPGVKYGLTLGSKKIVFEGQQHPVTDQAEDGQDSTVDQTMEELVIERKTVPLTQAEREEDELRRDLMTLPDQAGLDAYEEMPIEEFGKSLLRGMGWEEGKAIGRNCKVAVQPVQFVRRVDRTGLGAEPAPREAMDQSNRPIRPGQSRVPTPDLVAAPGQDGKKRNVVAVGEKLVERTRKGVVKGKVMSIISGRHVGLRGEVLDSGNPDRVSVKLMKSGEKILVNAKDLADVGSLEEEKVVKQIRELEISNGGASRRGHGRDTSNPFNSDEDERRPEGKEDRRDAKREKGSRTDGKSEQYGNREEERGRSKRNDHEYQSNSHHREDRKDRGRDEDDYRRERSRSDDRRTSSRTQTGQDRREEARNVENRRDGRKDDDNVRREQGRRPQDRDGKSAETDRVDREKSGSLASESNGGTGRYKDSWLTSQIRVRIISKTLKGGRLYLKKARIVDVVTPTVCDLLLDESGEILQHVKQDQLETALPKRGGRVMAVGGKQRGHLGKLIERDAEGEVGLVQLEETFEMVTLDLDLLAEYVGDVSERH